MPQVIARAWVGMPPASDFAMSQTTGEVRTPDGQPYVSFRPPASVGQRLLGREIEARIAAFARACADPVVLSAATGTH